MANMQQHAQHAREAVARGLNTVRPGDGYQASFVAMLNVMRRIHDMTGDPAIKNIIDDAERALSRR